MAADWKRVREVFEQALDCAPGQREAFLDEAPRKPLRSYRKRARTSVRKTTEQSD